MTFEDDEIDDIGYCAICEHKYGSPDCWNCPSYDGPMPGEEEDEPEEEE